MALFRMGLTDAETEGVAAVEHGMGEVKAPALVQAVLFKVLIKPSCPAWGVTPRIMKIGLVKL